MPSFRYATPFRSIYLSGESPEQMFSFYRYITGDHGYPNEKRRWALAQPGSYIQSLKVGPLSPHEDGSTGGLPDFYVNEGDIKTAYLWSLELPDALLLMPNLHSFGAEFDFQYAAWVSPHLIPSIMSRPRLRHLRLGQVSALTSQKFGQALLSLAIPPALQSARWSGIDHGGPHLIDTHMLKLSYDDGLGSILYASRHSLTKVTLQSVSVNELLSGSNVYSQVTELCFSRCKDMDHPELLGKFFPNVLDFASYNYSLAPQPLALPPVNIHGTPTFRRLHTLRLNFAYISLFF